MDKRNEKRYVSQDVEAVITSYNQGAMILEVLPGFSETSHLWRRRNGCSCPNSLPERVLQSVNQKSHHRAEARLTSLLLLCKFLIILHRHFLSCEKPVVFCSLPKHHPFPFYSLAAGSPCFFQHSGNLWVINDVCYHQFFS